MTARKTWANVLFALGAGALAACGSDDKPTEDAGSGADASQDAEVEAGDPDAGTVDDAGKDAAEADAGVADTEAPELRSLSVRLAGALPVNFDLTSADGRWVLPDAVTATFAVFARDDLDDTADLTVSVINRSTGGSLPVDSASFARGSWEIAVEVRAGTEVVVVVTDAAGNATQSEYALVLPSLGEALVGSWEQRLYDVDQTITDRRDIAFEDDGSYTQSGPDDGYVVEGTYTAVGRSLQLVQRTETGVDSDPDTVEVSDVALFYVDGSYFSPGPYVRDGAGDGYLGTWQRAAIVDVGGAQSERVETLELRDDDTYVETLNQDGTVTTRSGTYVIEAAESYAESFGEFLVRTLTQVDGADVAPEDSAELMTLRAGRLLVSPYVSGD